MDRPNPGERILPAQAPASLQDAFAQIAARRRSVYAFLPDPVPRPVVERAIDLAMLAPNHHRTRPWRFFVFADGGRGHLASAYEAAARRLGRDVAAARQRALDAPVKIVVACVPAASHPKVKAWEEEFATAAAVENMLLALASEGVASLLGTGQLALSPEVHVLVGVEAPARVMTVVSVGYRDPEWRLPARPEPDAASRVRWTTS